ncbi:UNVERIFIED_ORG: hypothetical protein ABIB19_002852 [Arthrobacter sp. UYEF10]
MQYANYLELTVWAASGATIFVGDVSSLPGRTLSRPIAAKPHDVLTFELRGKYVLPAQPASSAWTSPALPGSFSCSP